MYDIYLDVTNPNEHSGHCTIRMGIEWQYCDDYSVSDVDNFEYLPGSFYVSRRPEIYRSCLLIEEATTSLCDLMVKLDTEQGVNIDTLAAQFSNTVELQWLEHLWKHENMFDTGVVRANECES